MAEKILIVVDMQKDFVNGSLGSKDAEAIVPAIVKKAKEFDGDLILRRTRISRIIWTPRRDISFRFPTV